MMFFATSHLYIFDLSQYCLAYIGAEPLAGYDIKLVTFETILQNLASIQEIWVCLLTGIEVKKNVNIALCCILTANGRTKEAKLIDTN